jgi:hypothetical protein
LEGPEIPHAYAGVLHDDHAAQYAENSAPGSRNTGVIVNSGAVDCLTV